jgi:hypothetical protein
MYIKARIYRAFLLLIVLFMVASGSYAQKSKSKKTKAKPRPTGQSVMWEKVNVEDRDLFAGPGGEEMRPDLSKIEFIEQEKHGYNKKYRIKDGAGRVWVTKYGREAKPETAAVRLLWALGYKTEINYLVPTITIPGKGTLHDARLEARPADFKRLDEWKWRDNPFTGTNELQGLKMMMVFFANWDIYDLQNKIVQVSPDESDYIVSDLGATFGRLGNNNFPIFYRLGRKIGKPGAYLKGKFVKGVKNGQVLLAYKGKNRDLFKGITLEQARWLADLLNRLSDTQIRDAFRAANYSPADIDILTQAVKNRIKELDRAAVETNLAGR